MGLRFFNFLSHYWDDISKNIFIKFICVFLFPFIMTMYTITMIETKTRSRGVGDESGRVATSFMIVKQIYLLLHTWIYQSYDVNSHVHIYIVVIYFCL